ncbi:thymidine phosphorylase [Pseudoxanthobacter sp.]|uniref:thymidine phosphorylase n=1 Tax=Pseudoxanthobacter sp. TaxID=1925742 RepID=UPI002FE0E3CD
MPSDAAPRPPFLPQEVIRAKREGRRLPKADLAAFVAGITSGAVSEGQIAALAMAIYFRGLDLDERADLTLAMRDSGRVLDWSDLPGPALDKHSTGGVGDTVSLILGPLVAACGGYVPMISGRGLGHTGGTLDKFESIPGYVATPDLATFRNVVRTVGTAIIGQTDDLAPADRRFYAIRDVTATVETLDLITPSILSKKLAAGLSALVLDVKTGSGAFMATLAQSQALAESLVAVANRAGLPTRALITDMDSVLATSAGNALEVQLTIDVLTGRAAEPRLMAATRALAVEMLLMGGLADTALEAENRIARALASGAVAERFARMVAALGGPADLLERPADWLPRAPVVRPVLPAVPGTLAAMDMRALGLAVIGLGGGRVRPTDRIDPAVGLSALAAPGDAVGPDHPLCMVHAASEAAADAAAAAVRAACRLGPAPAPRAVVLERIA